MDLPAWMVVKLREEDISSPADLSKFNKKLMFQIVDNLCRPGGQVVDSNDPSATIETPSFVFGAKSQHCLLTSC